MLKISEQRSETPSTKTVRFEESMVAVAGQFIMVWVPGVDEYPMSISYHGDRYGFTYQIIGEGTAALGKKSPGETLGIRGPYGKGFAIHGKKLLLVGGGTGMAPLGPFVEDAIEHGAKVTVVCGARTKAELLFEDRSRDAGAEVFVSTDDGSKGRKGFASDLARSILEKDRFACVYTCGPEPMVETIVSLAREHSIPVQASLERLMKCGIGICDSCAIDGRHVCRDGPVFNEKELAEFRDLGSARRDACGRRIQS